jgi:hypothetical protein
MRALVANSFRRTGRQIVLFSAVMALITIGYMLKGDSLSLPTVLTGITVGAITGPFLWLLYRFARFLIGPST